MDRNLAFDDSNRPLNLSTVPWPTFIHFPNQSSPIAPREHGCTSDKCRRTTNHHSGLFYEADIHLVDDMTSFIEAYIRWADRKGVDSVLVVEEMRSKWKRMLNMAVDDVKNRWKVSLILGAINLAEEHLANSVPRAQ